MIERITEDFDDFTKIEIEDFKIIQNPQEYYSLIMEKTKTAKTVYLACLVFGSGKLASELLDNLKERMVAKKKTLVFMDKTRNERNKELINLVKEKKLESIVKYVNMSKFSFLPLIVNEFLGIYHDKAYIFDDEIIISGANLDDPYFVNRIDRYFLFKNRTLCREFKRKIFKDSLALIDDLDNEEEVLKTNTLSIKSKDPANENNSNKDENIVKNRLITSKTIDREKETKTFIFNFNDQQEIDVLSRLLRYKYKSLNISTAYLNFSKKHIELLKDHDFNLFTTSPSANTFNNFSFIGNIITDVYAYSSYKTKTYLPRCKLHEFEIPGFSFHSKGLWLFGEDYCISIVGSTNFNQRSIHVDRECSSVIFSNDEKIIKKLKQECEWLCAHSKVVTIETLRKRSIRLIAIIVFYILNLFI